MLPSLAQEILLNSNNAAAVARAFSGDLGCCYPFGFQRAVVIKSGRRTISTAFPNFFHVGASATPKVELVWTMGHKSAVQRSKYIKWRAQRPSSSGCK